MDIFLWSYGCFFVLLIHIVKALSCVTPEEHQILVDKFNKFERKYEHLERKYDQLYTFAKESNSKRFVLDGELDFEKEIITLHNEVEALKAERASTYVRWGRTSCTLNSTTVYKGYVGSNWYSDTGGPANYVCLPEDPSWAKYRDGHQAESSQIFGTEYEDNTESTYNPFSRHMDDHDVPCAVCRAPRQTTLMIPARTSCYSGWHLEYTGYLMAMARRYHSSSEYICVDADAETVPHGEASEDGSLLYVVEAACGSLSCPPYVDGRELACVVCSK